MFFPAALSKGRSWLTTQRVFVYALALAAITNAIVIGLYIHVPSFVERPGADFVQFYSAALLSRNAADKIYDVEAQKQTQKRFSAAARKGVYWPYLHAPFFTVLLIPLSFLSYVGAYWVWSAFTVILCCSSIAIISCLDPTRRPPLRLAVAVAYAQPVLYWLVATGQTTAIALVLWTVALVLMRERRVFWGAFVLGFLSYRAQYLIIVLPLLFIRRLWLGILGIGASCLLLFALGVLVFSVDAYWEYINAVLSQSHRIVTLQQPLAHYVTLYGFFGLLFPHWAAVGFTIASALPLIYWLLKMWRNVPSTQSPAFDLQWAFLMTATLLLMHHGFVYDLLLLAVPILLLYPYRSLLPAYYKLVLIVVYFIPYIFLMFPEKLPINPIQPILYWLCFEIYRVYTLVQPEAANVKMFSAPRLDA
jgi:Glycosyltransferase family 87